jgi:metallo-beta-lactamase family protein
MEIEFVGAAREVTGSCHILRVNGRTVVLDCGLFQGRRSETRDKNLALPIPVDQIDALVLSHAHIDHAGRLPFLVKNGYRNSIFATPATHDLCAIMLADSAHIQQKDAEFLAKRQKSYVEPFYDQADVAHTLGLYVSHSYDRPFDVVPGVRATFIEAGHILGSASVVLECEEDGRRVRLVFSGDIGRAGLPIIRDPVVPDGADAVIMESTYGNRDHPPASDMRERLATIVRETAARGGRVMIPAFAVGRTQEILYDLHWLAREQHIPAIPIFIDSPLAIDATSVFAMHPEVFDAREDLVSAVRDLFRFDLVQFTRDASESKALNSQHGPMIIIAASGMAETGRIVHHLMHGASDPRNTILIVGFQAEHTLGRRIVERQPMLKMFGEQIPLRARVEILNGYSAHAGRAELAQWIDQVRAKSAKTPRVWLVHGEHEAQQVMADSMRQRGYDVDAPAPRQRVRL